MQEIISIPALAILCAWAGSGLKGFDKFPSKHIPFTCSALGLILGVICYYTLPGYIPAENWIVAAAIGAVSGGFSTTAHQMYKQNKQ